MSADGELYQTTSDVRYELLRALDPDETIRPRQMYVKLRNAVALMESVLAVRDSQVWGDESDIDSPEEKKAIAEYMSRFKTFFGEDWSR